MEEEIRMLQTVRDPVERARRSNELATKYRAAAVEVAEMRRIALQELLDKGLNKSEIARLLDMKHQRVSQLLAARRRDQSADKE